MQVPLTFTILFIFSYFIWKGTHYEIFFCKKNLMIIESVGFIFFITNLLMVYLNDYKNELDEDTKFDIYFVKVLNMFNIFYLEMSWIYFGLCKNNFKYEGKDIVYNKN